jgi:hypothetical protein
MKKTISILSLLLILTVSCSSEGESDNACTPITCLNGGTQTVDCGCDCPEGYSGVNCSTRLTPSSVKITRVVVNKFPDRRADGDWWDTFPNSNADIYIEIENPSNDVIYSHPTFYSDASGLNVSYQFLLEPSLSITNVTGEYFMILRNYNVLFSDDLVAILLFRPYDASRQGFPITYNVSNPQNTFSCDITVEYTW